MQPSLRIVKDDLPTYFILLVLVPILVFANAKGIKTWTGLTALEIFGYTLMIGFVNVKRILPRINEGYIYA
jgi:hypothetical protein